MPKPRGHNPSIYIIICGGRINNLRAVSPQDKIGAASECAVRLVSQLELLYPGDITKEQSQPITDLQHEMMDNMTTWTKAEAESKVVEMFDLLDALEDSFE